MPRGIDAYHSVSAKNKEIIQGYINTLKIKEDKSKVTIKNYRGNLITLARFLGDKTLDDVIDNPELMDKYIVYLQERYNVGSRNTKKIALKAFYKWYCKKLEKPTKCLDNVELLTPKQRKRTEDPEANKQKEATEEEYNLLLEASLKHDEEVQMPAIIEVLRWFGCRPEELCSMNIGGAGKDGLGVFITIRESKTHTRKLYVDDYDFPYFLKYLDSHPNRHNPEAPVWISYYNRELKLARLKPNVILSRVKEVVKFAGIRGNISPKSLRHRCMNYRILELGMEAQQASYFFGTTIKTIMDNYIHNRQENYTKWLKAQHKGDLKPSYNELEVEKQKLQSDYEDRLKILEEKLAILDTGMAKSARQHKSEINSEQILQDYHKLRNGLIKIYEQMIAEGKYTEAEKFRTLAEQGLA